MDATASYDWNNLRFPEKEIRLIEFEGDFLIELHHTVAT